MVNMGERLRLGDKSGPVRVSSDAVWLSEVFPDDVAAKYGPGIFAHPAATACAQILTLNVLQPPPRSRWTKTLQSKPKAWPTS